MWEGISVIKGVLSPKNLLLKFHMMKNYDYDMIHTISLMRITKEINHYIG